LARRYAIALVLTVLALGLGLLAGSAGHLEPADECVAVHA
jgi:hypothetical protein